MIRRTQMERVKIKNIAEVLFESNYISVDEFHKINGFINRNRFNAVIGALSMIGIKIKQSNFPISGPAKLTADSELIVPGINTKKYINNMR
jgi:hypothetical protein